MSPSIKWATLLLWGGVTITLAAAQSRTGVLRPRDVVACVGGEDMVYAADCGFVEYLLLREWPDYQLKFRSLAKEGDTAFEQARDFNYPNLERQLAEIGATVVLLQVGQMESLRGKDRLAGFADAVEKLVERVGEGGKRRVILLGPTPVAPNSATAARFQALAAYADAVRAVAFRREIPCVLPGERNAFQPGDYRDGVHLNERGQYAWARQVVEALVGRRNPRNITGPDDHRLLGLVREKNQLWFHYVRPQNWAFLGGDRTVQPASRDHIDPERRWFPEEMKEWLPLIAAREYEMWTLAGKLRSD